MPFVRGLDLVVDTLTAAGAWLLTLTGAVTAVGLVVATVLVTIWRVRGRQPHRQAPPSQAAAEPPSITARLEARYGTDYPGFITVAQVDEVMAERTRHFFGRKDELAALDAFVASNPSRGIMIVTAPGGFGKSALLANWGRHCEAQGAAVAYHFFNATAARTVQPTNAFRGLLGQLAFLRDRPAPALPDDPAKLEDLVARELHQDATRDRPLIVILDGLDEAAELIGPLAPAGLGQHVYIVASGRAEPARRPERLAAWLNEAGHVGYPVQRYDMPELSVEGVLAWVRDAVPGLLADQEARLAQRLAATSEQVPLFLRYVIGDVRDRRKQGEPLSHITNSLEPAPAPFTDYAGRQLLAMRQMAGSFDLDVAAVFALLTLVKGALPLDELQEVLGARVNVWDFDPRITRWFVGRNLGDERAVAFLDPVLSEVFRRALEGMESTAGLVDEVQDQLIAHCRARWSKRSLYALTNLPQHQVDAGQVRDAMSTLTDLAFLDARLGHVAAAAMIVRTVQDFEMVEAAAPADLHSEIRAGRSFWATIEQHLLTLARGPQKQSAPDVMRQLLHDHRATLRQYATGHPTWVQAAGARAPQPLLRELKGHGGPVLGATALGDGRLLSWSDDGTLRLWTSNGTELPELAGHGNAVRGGTVLSDGRLLSWSADGTLRLWGSNGEAIARLVGHRRSVTGATVLKDGRLLSWSDDETLRLWTSDGRELGELAYLDPLRRHGPVGGATILSDGRLLSWSADGMLHLWTSSGKALAELKGHSSWVRGACALSDRRLLSWSDDGTLRLWTSDGASLTEMKGHSSAVESAIALSDGRLLSWSADATLRLWTSRGSALAVLEGHSSWVRGACALSDGRLLSWSDDGTLRLWASDGTALDQLEGHRGAVGGVTVLSDGRLLSWSADGTLRLWMSNGEAVTELEAHSRSVTGATVLNDGRVLSWSADGTLRLWASDATALAAPKGHRSSVRGTLVLSDGRLLSWTDERTGTLWLWDANGTALAELKGHSSWVVGARALSDGRLLSWGDDGTLRLWTVDGASLAEMRGHGSIVESAIALSDGRLLSWSRDGTLRLWTSDGVSLAEMKGHSGPVEGAVGLTDGQILSWSKDGTLRLWASDGTFLSLWLWPYAGVAGVTQVIPHPNRAGVFWVIAGNDVLQVRHQPADILAAVDAHDVSSICASAAGAGQAAPELSPMPLTPQGQLQPMDMLRLEGILQNTFDLDEFRALLATINVEMNKIVRQRCGGAQGRSVDRRLR